MVKLIILIFPLFFLFSCQNNALSTNYSDYNFEKIYFDVVEKKLLIEHRLPEDVNNLIVTWFNNKVKVNGFNGLLTIKISDYSENISIIDDGKSISTQLNFSILISKPSLLKKKLIEGKVESFGTITGSFSLEEFDKVIHNSQIDLVIRLVKELKNQI